MQYANRITSHRAISVQCLALYILLFFQLFNMNKTAAGMRFVLIPMMASLGLGAVSVITTGSYYRHGKHYLYLTAMVAFASVATITSSVVEWTANTSSFVLCALLYVIITCKKIRSSSLRGVLLYYAGLTVIISLWVIINKLLGINLLQGRSTITYFGVSKDQNYLSAYLAPGFTYYLYSYLFSSKKKRYCFFCASLILIAIYFTGSRAGLISVLLSGLVIVWKIVFAKGYSTRKIAMMLGITVGVALIYAIFRNTDLFLRMSDIDGYKDNIRLRIWTYAMDGYYQSPLIGSGIQAGSYYAQKHLRWFTHSCYIDMITSQGIAGVVLYSLLYLDYFRKQKGNRYFLVAMMISFFVPLGFINGYECITFWMPMIMMKTISDCCGENGCNSLLV